MPTARMTTRKKARKALDSFAVKRIKKKKRQRKKRRSKKSLRTEKSC